MTLKILPKNIGLIHYVYVTYLKQHKLFLANTKTKSEVSGGGRKPWRQKGTGKARAGSIRSPLWRGGGVIFGPRYHQLTKKINKKQYHKAIKMLLFYKQSFFIYTNFLNHLSFNKTKFFIKWLKQLGILNFHNQKVLIILEQQNKLLWLSSRNLPSIKLCLQNTLNIIDLIKYNKIILSPTTYIFLKNKYA